MNMMDHCFKQEIVVAFVRVTFEIQRIYKFSISTCVSIFIPFLIISKPMYGSLCTFELLHSTVFTSEKMCPPLF